MIWLALILMAASTMVLVAVLASGWGPVSSLRTAIGRFSEVADEADRLRRGLQVLERRNEQLRRSAAELRERGSGGAAVD